MMTYEEVDGTDFDYVDETDLLGAAEKQRRKLEEKAHMNKLQEEYLKEQEAIEKGLGD